MKATRSLLATLLVLAVATPATAQTAPAVPIPQNPSESDSVEHFLGEPASARPLRTFRVPRHPFMAPNGVSNLHGDAYQTDAHDGPGPLGRNIQVNSTFHVADCASVTFDSRGRIVTICVGVEGPRLVLMDPVTLDTLALHPLPSRGVGGTGSSIFNDFSGGGYFYLDHKDRAVIPTNIRQVWVVAVTGDGFSLERTYDLTGAIPIGENIVSVLPDWQGRMWFATAQGLVGTIDRASGDVATVRLDGEGIANSIAVDDSGGVYVVSDHAFYRFDARRNGAPEITWREPYDRGERVKTGQASQGSGTTPTVIGERYVAITDNAEPRMNVLVYRRAASARDRLVCAEPVFAPGASNTDQSLIAVGRSLIAENNYGYGGPASTMEGATTTPGLSRVDIRSDGCETVWESEEIAPSVVPKVSLATGLVYTYTKPETDSGADAWYLTAIDFRTGRTVYKQLAGTGLGFNNNYAPVTLGPDGAAYVGVLGGLVRLADS